MYFSKFLVHVTEMQTSTNKKCPELTLFSVSYANDYRQIIYTVTELRLY